ncbi:MAG: hypothetical protein E6I95_15540, partial [Chloroflexi bacterium]
MDSAGSWLGLVGVERSAIGAALVFVAVACGGPANSSNQSPSPTVQGADGIHKIEHVVVIMQENRSLDQYFGTYPGADGLPRQGGQFT